MCTLLCAWYKGTIFFVGAAKKKKARTVYLEVFDTGCNVLFIKLFAEVKHM